MYTIIFKSPVISVLSNLPALASIIIIDIQDVVRGPPPFPPPELARLCRLVHIESARSS